MPLAGPTSREGNRSPYLTPDQAAALLRVAPCTLRRWRQARYGPPYYRLSEARKVLSEQLSSTLLTIADFDRSHQRNMAIIPTITTIQAAIIRACVNHAMPWLQPIIPGPIE